MTRSVGRAGVPSPVRPESYRGTHRSNGKTFSARNALSARNKKDRHIPAIVEVPFLVVLALCLALFIRTFIVEAFYIPSGSMEQSLLIGDRVLVNKLIYNVRDPRRGEVIVFRGTDSWAPERPNLNENEGLAGRVSRMVSAFIGFAEPGEKDFIKRVVGLPGDEVVCCDSKGRLAVNGKGLNEPYIFENTPRDDRAFGPITVPKGRLFVMGDHRGWSKDSRAYLDDGSSGTVPIRNVIGMAFVKVWPVSRWGGLAAPKVFADVPRPGSKQARKSSGLASTVPVSGLAAKYPSDAVMAVGWREGRSRRLHR